MPAFLLGLIISTIYGAGFHFWRGGGAGRLLLYLLLAWAGFLAGHWVSGWLNTPIFAVGNLNLGGGTLGSLLLLGLGYWLSLVEVEHK